MHCRICGNNRDNTPHVFRERMYGLGDEYPYFECSLCGCLQIEQIPEDLSQAYPSGYCGWFLDPEQVLRGRLRPYAWRLRDRYALFGRGLVGKMLSRRLPAMPAMHALAGAGVSEQTSVLDVGCGSGLFCYALRNAGFRKVLGIDPHIPLSIRYGNGLEVRRQSLDSTRGEWDAVTFIDSFEHIDDPAGALAKAASLMSPGGSCIIRTPVVPNHAWSRYGEHWVQADAPRHLHIQSRRSMGILAEAAGLKVERVVYDSTDFQFWGSEQYMRGIALRDEDSYFVNPRGSRFSDAEIREYRRQAEELNRQELGDNAVFYLKRRAGGEPE